MKKRRTPREKKELSLDRDCRNTVAESPWGARAAIARRTRWVNPSYHKAVQQEMSALSGGEPADAEAIELAAAVTRRHGWRKQGDMPLRKALTLRRSKGARGKPPRS